MPLLEVVKNLDKDVGNIMEATGLNPGEMIANWTG